MLVDSLQSLSKTAGFPEKYYRKRYQLPVNRIVELSGVPTISPGGSRSEAPVVSCFDLFDLAPYQPLPVRW